MDSSLRGGRDLAGQQMQIRKLTVYPVAAVDVLAGSPLPGPTTHNIRVALPTEGEAIILPCDKPFLGRLARQINELLTGEGVANGN